MLGHEGDRGKVNAATGERLRLWREHRALTQRELADAIGVTPQAVSLWENGESPRPAHIHALDDALQADGEVVALYDLLPPEVSAHLRTELAAAVQLLAALEARDDERAQQLAHLEERIARLERAGDDSGEVTRRRRR